MLKCFNLTENEILTRLSNAVIQLHFPDFTSLIINRNDEKGIYYINQKGTCEINLGRGSEINYNQCRSPKLKTKIRRFSNLIQRLSSGEEDEEDEGDRPETESEQDDSQSRWLSDWSTQIEEWFLFLCFQSSDQRPEHNAKLQWMIHTKKT